MHLCEPLENARQQSGRSPTEAPSSISRTDRQEFSTVRAHVARRKGADDQLLARVRGQLSPRSNRGETVSKFLESDRKTCAAHAVFEEHPA